MRLGIDVRQADQQIRSTVVLPAGLGKEVKVCVIAKGAKATEATEAGADLQVLKKSSKNRRRLVRIRYIDCYTRLYGYAW